MKKLVVTFKDMELLHRVSLIPKPSRGKFVERALALYLESHEGSAIFKIMRTDAIGKNKGKPSLGHANSPEKTNLISKVLGDLED